MLFLLLHICFHGNQHKTTTGHSRSVALRLHDTVVSQAICWNIRVSQGPSDALWTRLLPWQFDFWSGCQWILDKILLTSARLKGILMQEVLKSEYFYTGVITWWLAGTESFKKIRLYDVIMSVGTIRHTARHKT